MNSISPFTGGGLGDPPIGMHESVTGTSDNEPRPYVVVVMADGSAHYGSWTWVPVDAVLGPYTLDEAQAVMGLEVMTLQEIDPDWHIGHKGEVWYATNNAEGSMEIVRLGERRPR